MKKWMIAGGLMMMISLSTFAQKRDGERLTPEQRATRSTEKMAEELSLDDAQKKQILEINLEYAKKREAEMAERKAMAEARRAEMEARRAQMKEQSSEIQSVLTLEQREKWVEIKEQRNENWKRNRPKAQIERTRDPRKGKKSGGN